MSAGDVYLQIVEDDHGRPVLHYQGREFGVLEPPHFEFNYHPYGIYHQRQYADVHIGIRARLIEPEPKPAKPKRTWATAMGLRKPKKENT
ncbi:hypothetical protein PBI_RHYNO_40 [Mycobacterium phage RhynO]|uniref:hypothetical protein n=1 Tax=Mycobacterium phage RhynO TaxID=1458846 RepID=UPI0003F1E81E|nr:hypothetical protein CG97_gp42 [Mycobacterium phage RhynO]AHJ88698.1 hypothetical protein PBI_RHYNO_40 [Mycobacterium phage RhynO]